MRTTRFPNVAGVMPMAANKRRAEGIAPQIVIMTFAAEIRANLFKLRNCAAILFEVLSRVPDSQRARSENLSWLNCASRIYHGHEVAYLYGRPKGGVTGRR